MCCPSERFLAVNDTHIFSAKKATFDQVVFEEVLFSFVPSV